MVILERVTPADRQYVGNRVWSKGRLCCRKDAKEQLDPCTEHTGLAGLRPQVDLHMTPCGLNGKTYANKVTSLGLRQLTVVSGGQIVCDMDEEWTEG